MLIWLKSFWFYVLNSNLYLYRRKRWNKRNTKWRAISNAKLCSLISYLEWQCLGVSRANGCLWWASLVRYWNFSLSIAKQDGFYPGIKYHISWNSDNNLIKQLLFYGQIDEEGGFNYVMSFVNSALHYT